MTLSNYRLFPDYISRILSGILSFIQHWHWEKMFRRTQIHDEKKNNNSQTVDDETNTNNDNTKHHSSSAVTEKTETVREAEVNVDDDDAWIWEGGGPQEKQLTSYLLSRQSSLKSSIIYKQLIRFALILTQPNRSTQRFYSPDQTAQVQQSEDNVNATSNNASNSEDYERDRPLATVEYLGLSPSSFSFLCSFEIFSINLSSDFHSSKWMSGGRIIRILSNLQNLTFLDLSQATLTDQHIQPLTCYNHNTASLPSTCLCINMSAVFFFFFFCAFLSAIFTLLIDSLSLSIFNRTIYIFT